MVTMDLLQCRLGFTFSAGLFDYVLNFGKATRPLLLLPVGLAYAALYYGLFRYCIVRFDLPTPGRERQVAVPAMAVADDAGGVAAGYVAALGGAVNFASIDACTTRLRLVLHDRARADPERLRALGASGSVKIGERGLQVVVGPVADQLAGEMRAHVAKGASTADWLAALGGAGNVVRSEAVAGRVLVTVKDASRVDTPRLLQLGARAVGLPSSTSVHVLHEASESLDAQLSAA
jgi:PTS system N-acetylglucosamine-specific IIC component